MKESMRESKSPRRTPKIRIPSTERVTPEEIARRSRAVDKILEVRRKIGPIGIAADQLVHEARKERGCD